MLKLSGSGGAYILGLGVDYTLSPSSVPSYSSSSFYAFCISLAILSESSCNFLTLLVSKALPAPDLRELLFALCEFKVLLIGFKGFLLEFVSLD